MKSIYNYIYYNKYIGDFYKHKKNLNPKYSFALMAKQVGMASKSTIKLIIDGKRSLGFHYIPNMTKVLGLTNGESQYFQTLVLYNHTKESKMKNLLYDELKSFPQRHKLNIADDIVHQYFSRWYYPVLREMVLLQGFPIEASMQALFAHEKLNKQVTVKKIQRAFSDLLSIGFLIRQPDGRITQSSPLLSGPDEVKDLAIRSFYRSMLDKAAGALNHPLDQREYGSVTLAVKDSEIPNAKQMIKEFVSKFNATFSELVSADKVYHMSIQFYNPLEVRERTSLSNSGEKSC